MTPARAIEILRDPKQATDAERAEAFALAVRRLSLPRLGREYSVEIRSEIVLPGQSQCAFGRPDYTFKPCYLDMNDPTERGSWRVETFIVGQRLQDIAFLWDGCTTFDTAQCGQTMRCDVVNISDKPLAFAGRLCGVAYDPTRGYRPNHLRFRHPVDTLPKVVGEPEDEDTEDGL